MTPFQDNALTALERARQAQERFERRIDVQLRLDEAVYGMSVVKAVMVDGEVQRVRVDPTTIQ